MTIDAASSTGPDPQDIGARLKKFRKERGHSLTTLGDLTGISEATLSRVENGQTLVSAHNLYALSKALNVDITALYEDSASPLRSGIRSISRSAAGHTIATQKFTSTVFGSDLANKKMHPALNEITACDLEEAGGLSSHDGEEFLFVVSGKLVLHSQHYAPLLLEAGDSIYFDGSMPHAYLSADKTPAHILVVTSIDTHQTKESS